MAKPLLLDTTSSFGSHTNAFHHVDKIHIDLNATPTTTVSMSAYIDEAAFSGSKTPILEYSFKFNMDVNEKLINNPVSQSIETLRGIDPSSDLQDAQKSFKPRLKNGSRFGLNFKNAKKKGEK
jgi:hypothetical protein